MAITVVESEKLAMVLTQRIQRRLDRLSTNNPQMKAALLRIGHLIEGEAKQNIRQAKLIDTSRLINSIRHFVLLKGDISELTVGSFGVPYAAVHEFGFEGTVGVNGYSRRAHAKKEHTRTRRGGAPHSVRAHEVQGHSVKGFSRKMSLTGHHYLGRAADKHAGRITQIIQEMFRD